MFSGKPWNQDLRFAPPERGGILWVERSINISSLRDEETAKAMSMTKSFVSSSSALILTISVGLILSFGLGACRKTPSPPPPATFDESTYRKEIEKWQSDRLTSLNKQDGWLTLINLVWLKEGENKFGSDPANAIRLPKDRAPLVAGSLWLENGHVRMTAHPAVEITAAGVPVTSLDLKDDTEDR